MTTPIRGAGHAQELAKDELVAALNGLLAGIYLHDEDGLTEHAECVIAARAVLAKYGRPS
jgi:hypothetical protein